ncbi:trk system potassium uptake protein TrkA [Haloactinospora alba]|uniref:Trk system potassium uptake protein TrkA n=1 Tax=Haloactinospora alba TaxID=405555 RepID=A0A543NJD7_9ACTN|nr:TrkA family potassium uptake protein [Haloactinospora alba]TQN31932.1 trk system potassium uptake protein TrkA [Haloactinospora alba]
MHIVILGCGRVGATLAHTLEDLGNTVAVIDRDHEAFRRLRASTAKAAVRGLGHDRAVLTTAGIESASAFAAVSNGDNSNIISARVARETFGVEHVVARIYDPRRAEVYQRLGIPTVGTVRWTADTVLRRLVPGSAGLDNGPLWRDPSGTIVLDETPLPEEWVDWRVENLEAAWPVRVAYLSRGGELLLPRGDEVLRAGDVLHVLARTSDIDGVLARSGARASSDETTGRAL